MEFPEDVLFNCCCERSEASGGWRATKIGSQLAGSRITPSTGGMLAGFTTPCSRDRIVPVELYPSLSSVDESIRSSPVDEETPRFFGQRGA